MDRFNQNCPTSDPYFAGPIICLHCASGQEFNCDNSINCPAKRSKRPRWLTLEWNPMPAGRYLAHPPIRSKIFNQIALPLSDGNCCKDSISKWLDTGRGNTQIWLMPGYMSYIIFFKKRFFNYGKCLSFSFSSRQEEECLQSQPIIYHCKQTNSTRPTRINMFV